MKAVQSIRMAMVMVGVAALLASGCSPTTTRYRSSLVEFLYPDRQSVAEQPSAPALTLPLKAGIAFVPDAQLIANSNAMVSEAERTRLLQKIAEAFRQSAFVSSIEIIPSAYLSPEGSFTNLDQIAAMYGIDAVALLSYDQVQHTDEGMLTLTYWTVVGAYTIQGEKNSTNTMLDAAVFHIKSRTMLFRAPGISFVKGSATPVNLSASLREDSLRGYELAAEDLVANLTTQIGLFSQAPGQDAPEGGITEPSPR